MTWKQLQGLFRDYWWTLVLGGMFLGIIAYFAIGIDSFSFRRGVEKDKQAIEDKKAEIAPLEAQREAIDAQINEKKGELTILEKNAAEAEKQKIEAGNASNQALANQNNIENQNFNGTSYEDAQKARCAAGFKEACK